MKKVKILALALTLSAISIGVGYAAWTDTMVINTTVETGELNVKFDQGTFSQLKYPDACADQYVKASAKIIDENDHSMQIELNGLYPGSWAAFRVKGVNAGTIPAKLDSIDVQFNGDKDLLPFLTYKTNFAIDSDGENNKICLFNLSGHLDNLEDNINDYLKDNKSIQAIQLEPNNKGCFYIGIPQNGLNNKITDGYIVIEFDKKAPNDFQNKTLTFTLRINFKQFNQ